MPKKANPVTLKLVRGCARCGKNHDNLTFQPLTRSGPRYSHWASCPTNGEPVMLVVLPDRPAKKAPVAAPAKAKAKRHRRASMA